MAVKTDIWLGCHLALATDSGIDIRGNECDASSALAVLLALCPEFIGCTPTKTQLINYAFETYGWTVAEAIEYMGDN